MDQSAIRVVNTLESDLERGNIEHVVRVFGEISQVPKDSKLLRGKVVLGFPSCDADPRPNWQIPAVRRFIQNLDRELPHFPYFLLPDLPLAHVGMYLLSLTDEAESGAVQPIALQRGLKRIEGEVRTFCYRIADSPEPVVQGLYTNLPPAFLKHVPELAAVALRSMRALLMNIADKSRHVDPLDETAIVLACELAGIERDRYPDRNALLRDLLARIDAVSP